MIDNPKAVIEYLARCELDELQYFKGVVEGLIIREQLEEFRRKKGAED